jgi:hypothetical protein
MPRAQVSSPTLGWVIALVGLGWLGSNLGVDPSRVLGALWPWPLFLLILGVAVLLGGGKSNIGRGVTLILAGVLVWAARTHMFPLPYAHVVAPGLMVVIGGWMVWRAMEPRSE